VDRGHLGWGVLKRNFECAVFLITVSAEGGEESEGVFWSAEATVDFPGGGSEGQRPGGRNVAKGKRGENGKTIRAGIVLPMRPRTRRSTARHPQGFSRKRFFSQRPQGPGSSCDKSGPAGSQAVTSFDQYVVSCGAGKQHAEKMVGPEPLQPWVGSNYPKACSALISLGSRRVLAVRPSGPFSKKPLRGSASCLVIEEARVCLWALWPFRRSVKPPSALEMNGRSRSQNPAGRTLVVARRHVRVSGRSLPAKNKTGHTAAWAFFPPCAATPPLLAMATGTRNSRVCVRHSRKVQPAPVCAKPAIEDERGWRQRPGKQKKKNKKREKKKKERTIIKAGGRKGIPPTGLPVRVYVWTGGRSNCAHRLLVSASSF